MLLNSGQHTLLPILSLESCVAFDSLTKIKACIQIVKEIPRIQIKRSVRGVYFALNRRGLIYESTSLVSVHKGKNKGKRSFLW